MISRFSTLALLLLVSNLLSCGKSSELLGAGQITVNTNTESQSKGQNDSTPEGGGRIPRADDALPAPSSGDGLKLPSVDNLPTKDDDFNSKPTILNPNSKNSDPGRAPSACDYVLETVFIRKIDDGATITRPTYEASQVPRGVSCHLKTQQGVCKNGKIEWVGNYIPTCTTTASSAKTCSGDSERIRWAQASPKATEGCRSEVQKRVCNQGTWGNWGGSFQATSCNVQAVRSCFSGNTRVEHNSSKTFYETNRCDSNKEFLCVDGQFFPSDQFRYPYTSCQVGTPPSSGASCPAGSSQHYFNGLPQGCLPNISNPPPGTNRCGAGCSPLQSGGCYCM